MLWFRVLPVLMAYFLLAGSDTALAFKDIKYLSLHPAEEDILFFPGDAYIRSGTTMGHFIIGAWPDDSEIEPPFPPTDMVMNRGQIRNTEWANPFLLRVDPSNYFWLTNPTRSGLNTKYNMGGDPIIISFDRPVCAIGINYAQAGGFNRFHPDYFRRTTIRFFDHTGLQTGSVDELPSSFIVYTAYQTEAHDGEIWAISMDSEVEIAIRTLIAMPCAIAFS